MMILPAFNSEERDEIVRLAKARRMRAVGGSNIDDDDEETVERMELPSPEEPRPPLPRVPRPRHESRC